MLAAFSIDDADDEALAVDVLGFDGKGFAHAEPALVDDGEVGAVAAVVEGAQEPGYLGPGEDVGERLGALDLDLFPDVPAEPEVVTVERAQGTEGLVERAGGELAPVL